MRHYLVELEQIVFVIELHDDKLKDPRGTLVGRIGRHGSIDYAYQVEIHLQDEDTQASQSWRRAYALLDATATAAVWSRDGVWTRKQNDTMQYVRRAPYYGGEWELRFLHEPATLIATGRIGLDAKTFEEAEAWAHRYLEDLDVATAVMLHNGEVYAAWERGPESIVLVVRGKASIT